MIGLDTNVITRFMTKDNEEEWQRVHNFMGQYDGCINSIYITDAVICETAWVLKATYKYSKERLIAGLELLIGMHELKFSDRTLLKRAIELYKNGAADFADYFIILKNQQAGCEYTYSFDKKLLKEQIAVPIPN